MKYERFQYIFIPEKNIIILNYLDLK